LSGIVGIVRRDGAPVEQSLLRDLTNFLSYRGPDASTVWSAGSAGFGHTLLRTRRDLAGPPEPANVDGRFWITADSRIDCREDLVRSLAGVGRECPAPASDASLIGHAYAAWGENCVEHLRGDFAFAVWDAGKKSLFCARDHFGIKPFYYAEQDDVLVFSNTLNCLRGHPAVSDELNEAAIADFLIFGLNYDLATTTFRDIRRLPPAHFLVLSSTGVRVQRYWSPPTNGRVRYTNAAEYAEHFQSIFQAAVADRLDTERAGILLSGGLDSGAVAATAREVSRQRPVELRAYTVTYDSLLQDGEGAYASATAEFLKMPIRFFSFDQARPFDHWEESCYRRPEPDGSPFFAAELDQFQKMAADCRVVLSGEGSDNLMLFEMRPYLRSLWRERRWSSCLRNSLHFLSVRPFPWRGIRQRIRGFTRPAQPFVPSWVQPDFARRMNLGERWRQYAESETKEFHPILPTAHSSLALPQWTHIFESDDPGVTRAPLEVRYPFLDLRVVNYLLSLPPFPGFLEKRLLRSAMAGQLPEKVLQRKKKALARDPLAELLKSPGSAWQDEISWDDQIAHFVDVPRVENAVQRANTTDNTVHIRPYCLNFWLRSAARVRYKLGCAEARHG
jgi:asparagine synthase (glutamine-hydrolysing)